MVAVRLADLLVGLSRLADLGFGLEAGTALRSCAVATRLARSYDLPEPDVRATFYTALLHHVGCAGFASESARLLGDDLVANTAAGRTDTTSPRDLLTTFIPTLTRGKPPLERARLAFAAATRGGRWGAEFTATACEVGRDTARRMQLPDEVEAGLFHVFDTWRGRTRPEALTGGEIPVAARIARLAAVGVLFESIGGWQTAAETVRQRAGGMLDPELAGRFVDEARDWFADLAAEDGRALVLDAEPHPAVTVSDVRVVAEVFGDLADLKSPFLHGHSRTVARLAAGAAHQLDLPTATARDLEVAGLLHDVGRVAVPSSVWDKPGPLGTAEWEQVRLHAYQSERILAPSAELARLGPVVGRHHERLDGSGYHRGCVADELPVTARVLAAADEYAALVRPRPHRDGLSPERARRQLLEDARSGTLDLDAARAVLAAAGAPTAVDPAPAHHGLSEREVEVLRLVAQGCTNAETADRLVISRRTAEHHVQHIYDKIGVRTRAAATLYAVRHHLLETDGAE